MDVAIGGRHVIAATEWRMADIGNGRAEERHEVYVWGSNYFHELGQGAGNNADSHIPLKVPVNIVQRRAIL